MKVGDLVRNTYLEEFGVTWRPTKGVVLNRIVSHNNTGYYDVLLLNGETQRWYEKELEVISESR